MYKDQQLKSSRVVCFHQLQLLRIDYQWLLILLQESAPYGCSFHFNNQISMAAHSVLRIRSLWLFILRQESEMSMIAHFTSRDFYMAAHSASRIRSLWLLIPLQKSDLYGWLGCHHRDLIATALVHSRLYYCNFLYHALSATQIKRLQQIQNAFARTVTRTSKHSRITPALKSLHWLNIEQRIQNSLHYPQYPS